MAQAPWSIYVSTCAINQERNTFNPQCLVLDFHAISQVQDYFSYTNIITYIHTLYVVVLSQYIYVSLLLILKDLSMELRLFNNVVSSPFALCVLLLRENVIKWKKSNRGTYFWSVVGCQQRVLECLVKNKVCCFQVSEIEIVLEIVIFGNLSLNTSYRARRNVIEFHCERWHFWEYLNI